MNKSNNASTSREKRFLRAWTDVHLVKDDGLRLRAALKLYEERVIMEDWEDTPNSEDPLIDPGYVDYEELLVNFSFD